MRPSSSESGSVDLALAARREVFDPRRQMLFRHALSWLFVGLGVTTIAASLFLSFLGGGAGTTILMLILGAIAAALGLVRVDRAVAALRRYDQHVRPLPQARLRLRLPPS